MPLPKCNDVLMLTDGVALCHRPTEHPGLHATTLRSLERIGDVFVMGEVLWGTVEEFDAVHADQRRIYTESRDWIEGHD